MVSGAHGDPVVIEEAADVIGVMLTEVESNYPFTLRRAVKDQIRYRAQQMLEAIIAEAIEAGTLRACDPQEAADELAGLWLGMTSLAIKLGARPPLSDDEIKQRVERALDVFLRAYSLTPG